MMEERFGPIGNPRYKEYLKDIHTSGAHVVSLVNDLLDLSKIEAGKLDLDFVSVDLNDVLAQCMALMQPQANRERIIIRTSLAPRLPPVVADARSMRQIVLNLLSNSIRFTQPGGQVILSTALSRRGEVVVRVRDTGVGMNEADIAAALEPFRQINTSGRRHPRRRHRARPAAHQGAGGGQPRHLRASAAASMPARWSRSPSRPPACWRSDTVSGRSAFEPYSGRRKTLF